MELLPRFAEAVTAPEARSVAGGEVVFEQDSRGDRIYIVDEGEIDLVRIDPSGEEVLLATRTAGEHFGEMGPLFNLPRSATARARTAARVTGYGVRDFRERFGLTAIDALIRQSS